MYDLHRPELGFVQGDEKPNLMQLSNDTNQHIVQLVPTVGGQDNVIEVNPGQRSVSALGVRQNMLHCSLD